MDWIRDRADALQERLGFGEDPEAVENQSLLSQFNEARLAPPPLRRRRSAAAASDLIPPRVGHRASCKASNHWRHDLDSTRLD